MYQAPILLYCLLMKKYLIIGIAVVIAIAAVVFLTVHTRKTVTPSTGSGGTTLTTGVRGIVLLGPTCPVEHIPPNPACADKPYATAIAVYSAGSESPYMIGSSDANGAFEFPLPLGSYTLAAAGGTVFPRCAEASVVVTASGYATTTISCDTGIR